MPRGLRRERLSSAPRRSHAALAGASPRRIARRVAGPRTWPASSPPWPPRARPPDRRAIADAASSVNVVALYRDRARSTTRRAAAARPRLRPVRRSSSSVRTSRRRGSSSLGGRAWSRCSAPATSARPSRLDWEHRRRGRSAHARRAGSPPLLADAVDVYGISLANPTSTTRSARPASTRTRADRETSRAPLVAERDRARRQGRTGWARRTSPIDRLADPRRFEQPLPAARGLATPTSPGDTHAGEVDRRHRLDRRRQVAGILSSARAYGDVWGSASTSPSASHAPAGDRIAGADVATAPASTRRSTRCCAPSTRSASRSVALLDRLPQTRHAGEPVRLGRRRGHRHGIDDSSGLLVGHPDDARPRRSRRRSDLARLTSRHPAARWEGVDRIGPDVTIVASADKGIGLAIVATLLGEGAHVATASRTPLPPLRRRAAARPRRPDGPAAPGRSSPAPRSTRPRRPRRQRRRPATLGDRSRHRGFLWRDDADWQAILELDLSGQCAPACRSSLLLDAGA